MSILRGLFTDRQLFIELQQLREAVAASQRVNAILGGWLPDATLRCGAFSARAS